MYLRCYMEICPLILTSLRTLEKNADTVTSQSTRDVVTASVTSISEALKSFD